MNAMVSLRSQLQQRLQLSPFGQRWQQLPSRDRLALLGLGAFMAVVLIYLALWLPLQRDLQQSRAWYSQQRELHAYVLAHADQARQLAGQASNTRDLGILLYTEYVFPVQIAAVILLVAIIAAIALTLRERKDSRHMNPGDQVRVKAADRMRIVKMAPVIELPSAPPAAAPKEGGAA